MLNPVTRLYATAQQAAEAVKELKLSGYPDAQINVVHPPGDGGGSEAVVKAIMAGQVLKVDARRYAEHVLQGRTLVSARADFGRGAEVRDILDSFGPVSSGFTESGYELENQWDEGAPFSSAFRLKVLSKPRLRFLGLSELTSRGWLLSKAWGLPLLTRSQSPLFGSLLTSGKPILPGTQLIKSRSR